MVAFQRFHLHYSDLASPNSGGIIYSIGFYCKDSSHSDIQRDPANPEIDHFVAWITLEGILLDYSELVPSNGCRFNYMFCFDEPETIFAGSIFRT